MMPDPSFNLVFYDAHDTFVLTFDELKCMHMCCI